MAIAFGGLAALIFICVSLSPNVDTPEYTEGVSDKEDVAIVIGFFCLAATVVCATMRW